MTSTTPTSAEAKAADAPSAETPAAETRADRFVRDLAVLKIPDPAAGRATLWLRLGVVLMLVGPVLAVTAFLMSRGTTDALTQNDALTLGLAGITSSVVGAALFLRYSLIGVDHRSGLNVLPLANERERSSLTKSISSSRSLKTSSAVMVWSPLVNVALARWSSTACHVIDVSIRPAGARTHMSLNKVTVSLRSISGPAASTSSSRWWRWPC